MRGITVIFWAMLVLRSLCAVAQVDTIRPGTLFVNAVMVDTGWVGRNIASVYDRAFPPLRYWGSNYLYNLLFLKGLEKGWDRGAAALTVDKRIAFHNCGNYQLSSAEKTALPPEVSRHVRFRLKGGLTITDIATPDNLALRDFECGQWMSILHNRLWNVQLGDCDGAFDVGNNTIAGHFYLLGRGSGQIDCFQNDFMDSVVSFDLSNWRFRIQMAIENNVYRKMLVRCTQDTFQAAVLLANEPTPAQLVAGGPAIATRFDAIFEDCYIDGPLTVGKNGALARVRFEHCSFGPDASSVSLVADSVSFVDCPNLPTQVSLTLAANRDTCWLRLQHTNLGDASFIYGPGIHLAFDPSVLTDEYTGVYETLLSQLKASGKKESYERLDIEYHHFKASKSSFAGWIADKAQEQWWNYGYSRLRVVLWTLLFLGVFFLFNLIFWRGMQEVYPIPQEHAYVDRLSRPLRYRLFLLLRVSLYTVYVFFSLKIDLPRLRVARPGLVVYFFLQWLVGLWCLFFIVNALLKVGGYG